jgi:hypothetical protein
MNRLAPPARHLMSLVAVLWLLAPARAAGQAPGSIEGRVQDREGRPVASAAVTAASAARAGRATSAEDGSWHIAGLEPGLYQVSVERPGYRQARDSVQVAAGETARMTLVLELAVYTLDSLVVSGEPPTVSTTSTDLGSKVTEAQIALLPTTLDVQQLIALTPGARPQEIWGGASAQANAYSLDGTSVNDPGLGGAVLLPSPTWVQSLAVRGLGAGADVGGAQGGLVEVTTLEGGDVLQGSLRTSFESQRLDGSNLIAGEIGQEVAHRWDADAQLRGPLIRDRLHFALFGHLIQETDTVPSYLPGSFGAFVPQGPSLQDRQWLAKLTWTPSSRDTVRWSFMGRDQTGERVGQTGYQAGDATQHLHQSNLTGNFTWQRSWSSTSTLTLALGGFTARDERTPYGDPAVPGIEVLTRVNPPLFQNAPFRTRSAPSSADFKVTWTKRGQLDQLHHELKLGGEYTIGAWSYDDLRNGGMSWTPQYTLGFDPASPSTWEYFGIPTTWGGETRIDSHVRNAALFIQEEIGVAPWLTLDPGYRFGWWTGSLKPPGDFWFKAVSDHALEPRIGLVAVLDPLGGVVFKAHWGRYYQPMFAALFDRAEGAKAFTDQEIWTYLGPAPSSPSETFTLAQRDSLASLGLFRLEEVNQLDQSGRIEQYHQPYVDQTVLSLERAFGSRWKAGLVYVFRRNQDMVALVDRNIQSDYTVVKNVQVQNRFGQPVYWGGKPLVVNIALSNEDILHVQDLLARGELVGNNPGYIYAPPDLTPAELAALQYSPDYVLSNVPEATRRFEQLQLRFEGRYRTWWAGGSATLSSLKGNYNVVTGPDDYTTGGPGPWVRPNEQYNSYGALNNQSQVEAKVYLGGLLPAHFRGSVFFSFATGDRVTPTLFIDPLLNEYGVTVPQAGDSAIQDTLYLHPLLFQRTSGQRIFIQPRGTYRFESRASLDLHLERSFPRGRSEFVLLVDAFNVLGDQSLTGIQTEVNSSQGFFSSDYGRVTARVPPRTLRLGAEMRF